jgi:hypothetical protein
METQVLFADLRAGTEAPGSLSSRDFQLCMMQSFDQLTEVQASYYTLGLGQLNVDVATVASGP